LESGTEYEKVYIVVNMLLKFKEKTSYELVDKIVGDASNAAVEDIKKTSSGLWLSTRTLHFLLTRPSRVQTSNTTRIVRKLKSF
jgi:hypothetical protein